VRETLDVEQMARRDVVGGDVAAPASAAQRHRGVQSGRPPDGSMGRRRVHTNAKCRFLQLPKKTV